MKGRVRVTVNVRVRVGFGAEVRVMARLGLACPSRPILTGLFSLSGLCRCIVLSKGRSKIVCHLTWLGFGFGFGFGLGLDGLPLDLRARGQGQAQA